MTTLELQEIMRQGQRLTYEELRREAFDAVKDARWKQKEVAKALNVTASSVSRALKEAGSSFSALQIRIIELLTKYTVRPETEFVVLRKSKDAEPPKEGEE